MQRLASVGAFAGDDFGLIVCADELQGGFFFKLILGGGQSLKGGT